MYTRGGGIPPHQLIFITKKVGSRIVYPKTEPSEEEKIYNVGNRAKSGLINNAVSEAKSNKYLKELHEQRKGWEKYSKAKDIRQIAEVPVHIDNVAERKLGKNFMDYKNNPEAFRRFLEMEFAPGVKGEHFLTVPKNKL